MNIIHIGAIGNAEPLVWGLDDALWTDLVLTGRQLKRRYGKTVKELRAKRYLKSVELIAPTKNSKKRRVSFVALRAHVLKHNPTTLRHLALTAEIRHFLRVPADNWNLKAERPSLRLPDAFIVDINPDQRLVPVEIDVGTYSMSRIRSKLFRFRDEYGPLQIWGSPSTERLKTIWKAAEQEGATDNLKLAQLPFP